MRKGYKGTSKIVLQESCKTRSFPASFNCCQPTWALPALLQSRTKSSSSSCLSFSQTKLTSYPILSYPYFILYLFYLCISLIMRIPLQVCMYLPMPWVFSNVMMCIPLPVVCNYVMMHIPFPDMCLPAACLQAVCLYVMMCILYTLANWMFLCDDVYTQASCKSVCVGAYPCHMYACMWWCIYPCQLYACMWWCILGRVIYWCFLKHLITTQET